MPQIVALRMKDKQKDFLLVDVRPEEERNICRIPGDTHIPADKIEAFAEDFKGKEVVLYCKTGVRSALLADLLRQKGVNAKNLAGGIHEWADKVDPSIPKYGN